MTGQPVSAAVADWLARVDGRHRPVVDESRRLVLELAPDIHEIVYHDALGYGPSESGFDRILYIAVHRDHITLGFFFGALLADPTGLLVGEGARLRHIKVAAVARLSDDAVRAIVAQALLDGPGHVEALHQRRTGKRAAQ
jgi:hypothetical protein